MNKCSHCCTTMFEEKDSEVTGNSITADHDSVDKALSGKLLINDEKIIDNMNDPVEIHVQNLCVEEDEEEEEEDDDDDDLSEEELLAQMGYAKPQPERKIRKPQRRNFNEEVVGTSDCPRDELPRHEPVTTSMEDLNLVSALKGSREKQGKPAKGCRVSWAPGVYDPPPSAEHIAPSAFDRHGNETKVRGAAGKKRNKSGAGKSEGSGGKGSKGRGRAAGRDKKQGSWQWQQ